MLLHLTVIVCINTVVAEGVAPGDEDPLCEDLRTNGFAPIPNYSANMAILMDSNNYVNLLLRYPEVVWQWVDNDVKNDPENTTSWFQNSRSSCNQTVEVCGFSAGAQDNWLITQLINRTVNGTHLSQVQVLIEFDQQDCSVSLNCLRNFNTYVYETSSVDSVNARIRSNYQLVQKVSTEDASRSGKRVNETITIDFSTNHSSFYFAIQDEGTCMIVSRMIVFYTVCPAKIINMINYPLTIAPISGIRTITASCIENAEPIGAQPRADCSPNGSWNTSVIVCRCIFGTSNVSGACIILVPPGQPTQLFVDSIGATWALISWTAPSGDSMISRYEILAREVNGSGLVNVTTGNNSTFFNVTGLLPATTYSLSVVAVSEVDGIVARGNESESTWDTTGVTAGLGTTTTTQSVDSHHQGAGTTTAIIIAGIIGALLLGCILIGSAMAVTKSRSISGRGPRNRRDRYSMSNFSYRYTAVPTLYTSCDVKETTISKSHVDSGHTSSSDRENFTACNRHAHQNIIMGLAVSDCEGQVKSPSHYMSVAEKKAHVPFLDYQLLECDCNGREWTNVDHDITVRIPEGAVAEGEKIHFEIGVAMYGPFIFPDNTQPISPILWLCILEENVELKKPFQVVLPHYLTGLSKERLQYHKVGFSKASHDHIIVGNQMMYKLQKSEIEPIFASSGCRSYVVLESNHCCFYCLEAKKTPELAMDTEYCLTRIESSRSPERCEVYFSATYFLETCLRSLDEQFPNVSYKFTHYNAPFKFKDDTEPLQLIVPQHDQCVIALEPANGKIEHSDINSFWSKKFDDMQEMHKRNMYPPRLKMTISLRNSDVAFKLPVKFIGHDRGDKLDTELMIPLDLPCLSPTSSISTGSRTSEPQSHTITYGQPRQKDVLKMLIPLASSWRMIGALLGLESGDLDKIRHNAEQDANDCLQMMVSKWLEQPTPTWKDLADTVETLNPQKARDIRDRFCADL